MGLGFQSLLRDIGCDLKLHVWIDSSAAIGITNRQGLGKLRHLDTHTLWIQHALRAEWFVLRKVSCEVNPADLFTEHALSFDRLVKLTSLWKARKLLAR